jgi:hypothetical protein
MVFERSHECLGLAAGRDALAQMQPSPLIERRFSLLLHVADLELEAAVAELLEQEPRLLRRIPPAQAVRLPIERPR